jgi:hypothetical protein
MVGDLLEEIIEPLLQRYCDEKGYYLDKKGKRAPARAGAKVSWLDGFGNSHDLDFVIEKGGSTEVIGKPLAFIEVAWRRYSKHSKAKAQEIQGAVLPISDKHFWDKPFLGAVLAGVFTAPSIQQMTSSGFNVALFPYDSVVAAFKKVGVDVSFNEETPDDTFQRVVNQVETLTADQRQTLKIDLVEKNQVLFEVFMSNLRKVLGRQLTKIIVIALHGKEIEFQTIDEAIQHVESYDQAVSGDGVFRKYEIVARYSNDDAIDASFDSKDETVRFLRYIGMGA